ncbi:MAG: DUF445 domain-containing protein [Candidatus Rokuibacteriota bacterium]
MPRRQRRLALVALGAVAITAVVAFPVRGTWWGGFILAIAEAGVVGGLADWFAVTAIFRRPLGLPIPHTGLIVANWELMAARVGTMVGDRVLTQRYLRDEIARLDLGDALARLSARVTRDDLQNATRLVSRWLAEQVPPPAIGDLLERLRQLLLTRSWAPTLATALDFARERQWDEHVIASASRAVADALERPTLGAAAADLIEDMLQRYRESMSGYSRFWLGVADLLGFIDRRRIVAALRAGVREVAEDPQHPFREKLSVTLASLARRLRAEPALAARVEELARVVLESRTLRALLDDVAGALRRTLLVDVGRQRSELIEWVVERLERARLGLIADAELRHDLDRWIKGRVIEVLDSHHGRIADVIEKGVLALGPDGAVRLIEEHAGDDLQYIRLNGTVVGGLAGGAIYALHLLLRAQY